MTVIKFLCSHRFPLAYVPHTDDMHIWRLQDDNETSCHVLSCRAGLDRHCRTTVPEPEAELAGTLEMRHEIDKHEHRG